MATKRTALQDAVTFVKHYHGKDAFAPFTGQDSSAWSAFVYLVELYGRADWAGTQGALDAMRATLRCAQAKEAVLGLFVQAIPAILDWTTVDQIWPHVAPPAFKHLIASSVEKVTVRR